MVPSRVFVNFLLCLLEVNQATIIHEKMSILVSLTARQAAVPALFDRRRTIGQL